MRCLVARARARCFRHFSYSKLENQTTIPSFYPQPQPTQPKSDSVGKTLKTALQSAPNYFFIGNMSKVISLSNHKGGVGKTTSTVNISVGLSRMLHKRVLVIDMDPQANLTQSLGVEGNPQHNIYGALTGSYALHPIIIEENLHIIPATLDLSGAEVELSAETGREFILRELIDPLRSQYDYILIDTPPSLGLLTVNALTASDHIYIPLQAQYLALQGLTKLLEVVERIRKRLNRHLSLGGVFITQYDQRKVLNREIAQTIREHFKDKVFQTVIRDNIALAEAPSTGKDIFAYNSRSYGAEDYLELCKEIIAKK